MTRFEKCWGIHTGKMFGSKIAWASRKEGDRVGVGPDADQVALHLHPTLSPSFLLTQAVFEPYLFSLFLSQHFLNLVILHLPAYEDGTECSETSAYKIQTPGNYPEETIKHVLFVCIYPLPDSDCRELFEWLNDCCCLFMDVPDGFIFVGPFSFLVISLGSCVRT
jgi:hypothetical protein